MTTTEKREPAQELGAGPALDALIARHVFGVEVLGIVPCAPWHDGDGWQPVHREEDDLGIPRPVYANPCDGTCGTPHDEFDTAPLIFGHHWTCLEVVPEYSTEMADAWQVVERMKELTKEFDLSHDPWHSPPDEEWWCNFGPRGWGGGKCPWIQGEALAPTPALAICRAALKCMER